MKANYLFGSKYSPELGTNEKETKMGKLLGAFIALLALVIVGGGVFLATWDIPAPSRDVEITVDDSNFPR